MNLRALLVTLLGVSCVFIMAATRLITPFFVTGQSYELYKKEVNIWQNVTNIKKEERAFHLLLSLPGKDKDKDGIKDKLLETVKTDKMNKYDGVKYLLDCMDKFLAKDLLETKWEHFQEFETCIKKEGESMIQYIANFDTLYDKLEMDTSENLML